MNIRENLLACLAEEAEEVSKDCMKSLRFGLDDRNVLQPDGPTNRQRIEDELNDLFAVIQLCVIDGIISADWWNPAKMMRKMDKVKESQAYAEKVGALK